MVRCDTVYPTLIIDGGRAHGFRGTDSQIGFPSIGSPQLKMAEIEFPLI